MSESSKVGGWLSLPLHALPGGGRSRDGGGSLGDGMEKVTAAFAPLPPRHPPAGSGAWRSASDKDLVSAKTVEQFMSPPLST